MPHILIADDDHHISQSIADILNEHGYETSVAASGTQALQLVQNKKPDLVILDRWMLGMHGDQVLAELRANAETAKIPVILVSADRTGCPPDVPFIAKPFPFLKLLLAVEKAL